MLEDKMLVLKCKYGSPDAMCRIYRKYKDYLLTLANALLNDRATAEDVVHDVFLSFAKSVKTFQLKGSLKAYLSVCAANRARDILRAKKRHSENPGNAEVSTSTLDNPQMLAMEKEELMQLRNAINLLPYEHREAVVLHLKGEMKFKQIAKLQGVSVGTIHNRYRTGIDKLRSLLNSEVAK